MKRTFYVFWGRTLYAEHPIALDICDGSSFLNTEFKVESLKKQFPFPDKVTFTEIELDDFIPSIKLGLIALGDIDEHNG